MKCVLLVHEKLYGGGSRQAFYLLRHWLTQGNEAVLVSNAEKTALGQKLENEGLNVKRYFTPWIQRAINPIKDTGVFFYLLKVFLVERPDVMVVSGVKLMGLGSLAAWLTGIPRRVAIIRGQGAPEGSRWLNIIYKMEKFLAVLGTHFVTVCEFNRQEMIEKGICPADQVETVLNGTDITMCRSGNPGKFREQWNLPPNAFVIGMVGRLSSQKRYGQFVEFMARLCHRYPSVHGFLVGDGEEREALQEQINATGYGNRITITGYVSSMADAYADLDLSILFTHYEGCPNALLESSAAGVPMIADDICGNREVVHHGENGFIIQPGDTEQAVLYAQKIIETPLLAKELSEKGQAIAERSFNVSTQIKKLADIMSHSNA